MGDQAALDLDAFRALHPWPAASLALDSPLEWLWHYDLDAEPGALWPHLVDTSRLNRAMGEPEMKLSERDGLLHGEVSYGGLRHVWVEEPWDWAAGRYVCCVRSFRSGLGRQLRSIYRLEPLGAGRTRLYVYFGWIPRSRMAALGLRVGMRDLGRRFARVIRGIAAELDRPRPAILQQPGTGLTEEAQRRLASGRAAMRASGVPDQVVHRLLVHVAEGDEADLARMQVRALASAWGVPEDELLRACLHATRLGLLEMSWDILCPHCRGVRHEAQTLGDVPRLGSCEVCRVDFTTDKANAIEITFHVHPSVREVPRRFYCSAGLVSRTHVRVQQRLEAGASLDAEALLPPGRYHLRLWGQEASGVLDVVAGDAAAADRLTWRAGDTARGEAVACVVDDRSCLPISLINDSGALQTFIIEHATWADTALRPSRLFNFQEFRDLFSEEYVAADVQLAVGEQTILFTDMVGSTRFYVERGDPAAFVAVKQHFTVIYDVIGRNRGAVVKTIGDAAMGAFERPLDAVRAARQLHERFGPGQPEMPIRLRISLNLGSCIAVQLNSNIDYFGTMVNLAAKLQSCAGAGDIAMSRAVAEAPGVMAYLRAEGAHLEETVYTSDALDEGVDVLVWRTPAGALCAG